MFPRNIRGIAKGHEIYGFDIVEYSVWSESGRMIAIRAGAYYVYGSPKDLCIDPHKVLAHHKYTRVPS